MAWPSTILVADDEAHIRFFLKLVAKEIGIARCVEAADGGQALEMYKRFRPDIVMLDVNMPRMTGTEALAKLLEMDPEAIVVMMSSVAKRQVVELAAELGAAQYIRKDSSREDMIASLSEIIREFCPPDRELPNGVKAEQSLADTES